jgi:tRNA A-37 threonylcarbamoyl transferase component Bud32
MARTAFEQNVEQLVAELLEKANRDRLEEFRFHGSANLVYRIPVGMDGAFVVLKLLPPRTLNPLRRLKRPLRNLVYGEQQAYTGRERARLELERYREWREAGLPVPDVVETSLPDIRVIQGLPYPTFYSILGELPITDERRLEVLRDVTKSLAAQHRAARRMDKKGLVHRDPGPWNIMFDLDRNRTYWFDLEYPADQPMTVEQLCVRALRIFTFGVLDHLSRRFDEVMETIAEAYGRKSTLRLLADNLQRSAHGLPMRAANRLGVRKWRRQQQERMAAKLYALVA